MIVTIVAPTSLFSAPVSTHSKHYCWLLTGNIVFDRSPAVLCSVSEHDFIVLVCAATQCVLYELLHRCAIRNKYYNTTLSLINFVCVKNVIQNNIINNDYYYGTSKNLVFVLVAVMNIIVIHTPPRRGFWYRTEPPYTPSNTKENPIIARKKQLIALNVKRRRSRSLPGSKPRKHAFQRRSRIEPWHCYKHAST